MEEVTRLTEEKSALQSQVNALKSESESLKNIIEQSHAEKVALDQTLTEVLRANIALKAGCSLLEKKQNRLAGESTELNKVIEELRRDLARSEA